MTTNRLNILTLIFSLLFLGLSSVGFGASLEEKFNAFSSSDEQDSFSIDQAVSSVNPEIAEAKAKLVASYEKAQALAKDNPDPKKMGALLEEIQTLRSQVARKEEAWRTLSVDQAKGEEEGYGLWDQEETTISQLVLEYGSSDYLYIVPPDLASVKLNLHSSLPVPRESWSDLIEVVLAHNGIGFEQINPFARKLFSLKNDLLSASHIVSDFEALKSLSDTSRVIYVFMPQADHYKSAYHFLERFRDPKRMFVYSAGNKISLVATKGEVVKLVELYNSVWEEGGEKIARVVNCNRIKTEEMHKILKSYFGNMNDGERFSMARGINEIAITPLSNDSSIVLVGKRELVTKAEEIIEQTQTQLEAPCEMTLSWYSCKHSDPTDLAEVLQRVYASLAHITTEEEGAESVQAQQNINVDVNENEGGSLYPEDPIAQAPNPVEPAPALLPAGKLKTKTTKTANFIPYPKTGALMMVVRRDTLEKIQGLIKKLDVPKKMVHVEVLLCEKKTKQKTESGLNLLQLGSAAANVRKTGIDYSKAANGLFSFFISRPKTRKTIPAFDVTYNFLLSQNDIRINASPSMTMVNQTPARIALVEEISINSGAAPINTNSNITFQNAYIRKQYGITITMTPTIHEPSEGDEDQDTLITLNTDINFDTEKTGGDQPIIDRRNLKNTVRVVDGQTVVIGGLRRKDSSDKREKVPFLGEIPGIAKLFGTSVMSDDMTEMFLFITPKVINDPHMDVEKIMELEFNRRAGDTPEYLARLLEAQKKQKQRVFEQSFKLIFGNIHD